MLMYFEKHRLLGAESYDKVVSENNMEYLLQKALGANSYCVSCDKINMKDILAKNL